MSIIAGLLSGCGKFYCPACCDCGFRGPVPRIYAPCYAGFNSLFLADDFPVLRGGKSNESYLEPSEAAGELADIAAQSRLIEKDETGKWPNSTNSRPARDWAGHGPLERPERARNPGGSRRLQGWKCARLSGLTRRPSLERRAMLGVWRAVPDDDEHYVYAIAL